MIPLDELSRSHFGIYEIPDRYSEICNTKSSRLTLVQTAPKHFVSTWDEVNFQKVSELSWGQPVHKHKTQTFNFYTNYVEVIFVFLFSPLSTLRQLGTKLPISSEDDVTSNHLHRFSFVCNSLAGLPDNLSGSGLSRITKIIRDNLSPIFIFRLWKIELLCKLRRSPEVKAFRMNA